MVIEFPTATSIIFCLYCRTNKTSSLITSMATRWVNSQRTTSRRRTRTLLTLPRSSINWSKTSSKSCHRWLTWKTKQPPNRRTRMKEGKQKTLKRTNSRIRIAEIFRIWWKLYLTINKMCWSILIAFTLESVCFRNWDRDKWVIYYYLEYREIE